MKVLIVTAFALVLAACAGVSDETAVQPSTPTVAPTTLATLPARVVVTIRTDGGCYESGPNCPTYVVYSTGLFELQRSGWATREPVDTTTLDVSLVKELERQLAITDLDALVAALPPGECQACYDGWDTTFTYLTPEGRVEFNSAEFELPATEPLFSATWAIQQAAAAATDLPMLQQP